MPGNHRRKTVPTRSRKDAIAARAEAFAGPNPLVLNVLDIVIKAEDINEAAKQRQWELDKGWKKYSYTDAQEFLDSGDDPSNRVERRILKKYQRTNGSAS